MSKVLVEKEFGGDGAKAGLMVEDGALVVKVSYPLDKLLSPVNDVIDSAINKLEALIPGDWDKAVLEPVRAAAKAELVKLLSDA